MGRITRYAALPAIAVCALAGAAPVHADDNSYLRYLNDRGYTALYAGDAPIAPISARTLGHMICENLRTDTSVEQQLPHYPDWPQFALMAEAAQHELCPDTLR